MRAIHSILNVLAINVMTGTVFPEFSLAFPCRLLFFLWQRGAKNWHANKFGRKRGPLFSVTTECESALIYMLYIQTYTFKCFLYLAYMHIEYDISASACRVILKSIFVAILRILCSIEIIF